MQIKLSVEDDINTTWLLSSSSLLELDPLETEGDSVCLERLFPGVARRDGVLTASVAAFDPLKVETFVTDGTLAPGMTALGTGSLTCPLWVTFDEV